MIDRDRLRLDTAEAAAMQIFDQLAPGDQVALLAACGPASAETAKLERTQDSCARVARPMPPQLRPCRPDRPARRRPETVGQVGRPEQADLHFDRYAAGVVGNVGRRKNRFRGADCQGAFGERFQPGPGRLATCPTGKVRKSPWSSSIAIDNRSRTRPSKRSRWTLRPPSRWCRSRSPPRC